MTEADGTITLDVTVTDTGSVAGKDAVQVYFNPSFRILGKALSKGRCSIVGIN